ncbi:MAG: DUF1552 domain-containing protein, partial [Planctomycetota bacterium]
MKSPRRPPHTLHRRGFLQAAGAAFALPWLEALAPKGAHPPVRAAWLYFPNGVAEGSWGAKTSAGSTIRSFKKPMAPLERHRKSISLVRSAYLPHSGGHGGGTATWLTCEGWDERALDAAGPSVDQVAARAFATDHVEPALSISAKGMGFFAADVARNNVSWSAPGRPVFRLSDPLAAFQMLFGGGVDADRSLLDDLKAQLRDVRKTVSSADRERLDAYADAIRGVERRLAFVASEATRARLDRARAHGFPFSPSSPPRAVPENHGDYLDLLLDIVALALWSGASRVATLMLDHGQSNRYADFVPDVRGTWHALSHWRDASGKTEDDDGVTSWDSADSKRGMYDAVVTWHHARVARFLDRLASLPEADGTLLDQSLVVYGSNIADGHEHGEEDLPTLVAGGGGGQHRGGRWIGSRRGTSLA